ncbi:MAG TPA: hypothetical protein VIM93_11490 [Kangiella sp.]
MIEERVKKIFEEAELSRSKLAKKDVSFLGVLAETTSGDYLRNFAGCVLNRQIDIFDDTMFLLGADRVQAACTISRAMIETYAFSKHLYSRVHKTIGSGVSQEAVDAALKEVLKFTNSSRHKVNEQEKVAKGVFSLGDYEFTAQARERMAMGLAASEHVMNALRELYKEEKAHTGEVESRFELTYDILSEWVHPSQTSIFHHYVKETQMIPCSFGIVNLFDSARFQCAVALHFITDAATQYERALALAKAMDAGSEC